MAEVAEICVGTMEASDRAWLLGGILLVSSLYMYYATSQVATILDSLSGDWRFCLAIFIYFARELESFIFSPLDRLDFHQAL